MKNYDCSVVVVGAGPAGLAAAISARKNGAEHVIVIERENRMGGILKQCIHAGFGLQYFGEELTGPEYAEKFMNLAKEAGIEFMLNTTAIEIKDKTLICINPSGVVNIHFGALVLAMGCRERTRANLMIPGSRPAGIYTAGTAQKLINVFGRNIGKEVVILGSGDIGMIMARRLSLGGAKVKAVIEIMPYLAGLVRNKLQCLDDFNIPLKLAHTITGIEGDQRVTGVWVAPVDEKKQPIKEQEQFVECDTVLFSVGLMPENELTGKAGIAIDPVTNGPVVNQYMQTSAPAVFACGNVVHVNDLVDNVSQESAVAGKYAAQYAMGKLKAGEKNVACVTGRNVRYLCPRHIKTAVENEQVALYFRVLQPELGVKLVARCGDAIIASQKEFRVNPGEMNHIVVDTAKLTGDSVTVEVVKED
jgi:NADPH-dependent 2,4-dienoyl-CoA reductase/sulfur reductase-like enzyme